MLKPSNVDMGFPPFTGCFNRSEQEMAAGLIVRALQLSSDPETWRPVHAHEIGKLLSPEFEKTEPIISVLAAGIATLDPDGLVADGFAKWTQPGSRTLIELTDKALDRIIEVFGRRRGAKATSWRAWNGWEPG